MINVVETLKNCLSVLYSRATYDGEFENMYFIRIRDSLDYILKKYDVELFYMKFEESVLRLLNKGLSFKEFVTKFFEAVIRNYKVMYYNDRTLNKELRGIRNLIIN